MTTDLNTLLTALYVKIDDHLAGRRRMGRPPKLTDAELVTLAVAQALLGFTSEARWLRFLPAAVARRVPVRARPIRLLPPPARRAASGSSGRPTATAAIWYNRATGEPINPITDR